MTPIKPYRGISPGMWLALLDLAVGAAAAATES
jgi:hypothetical protein